MIYVLANDCNNVLEKLSSYELLMNTLGLEYIPSTKLEKIIYYMDYHRTDEVKEMDKSDIQEYVNKIEDARGKVKFRRRMSGEVLSEVLNRDIITDKKLFQEKYMCIDMEYLYVENPFANKIDELNYIVDQIKYFVDWKRLKLRCSWLSTKDKQYHNIFTKGIRLQNIIISHQGIEFVYDLSFGKPRGLSDFIKNKKKCKTILYPKCSLTIDRIELYTVENGGLNNKSLIDDKQYGSIYYKDLPNQKLIYKVLL